MKRNLLFVIALATLAVSTVAAQGPVLFDGTNPVVLSFQPAPGQSALPPNDAIPRAQLITADKFAKDLQTAKQRPLILNVGPRSMFAQAHIPGAEYMGAGSSNAGQQKLRERVQALPKSSAIVIYCGCCPWGNCPNMHPAYQLLHSLGLTNVKAIYIANDFGTDWVNKGYPVAKGD